MSPKHGHLTFREHVIDEPTPFCTLKERNFILDHFFSCRFENFAEKLVLSCVQLIIFRITDGTRINKNFLVSQFYMNAMTVYAVL